MLAVRNGPQDQLASRFVATDQLDNNLDIGIINHRKGIITDTDFVYPGKTSGIIFTRSSMSNADTSTGTPRDFRCIAPQDIKRPATYCAKAQQANINRIQQNYPPDTFD
jgi:hypothetical protein